MPLYATLAPFPPLSLGQCASREASREEQGSEASSSLAASGHGPEYGDDINHEPLKARPISLHLLMYLNTRSHFITIRDAMADKSARPTYAVDQISKYFKHISLPEESQDLSHAPAKLHHPNNALRFLTQLQRRQIARVPFENLQLHYSRDHTISLDPGFLFDKLVERGHGGYCMENNCFFGTVLRSLGFRMFSAGARVNTQANGSGEDNWEGWSHMVNIVTLSSGQRYMLDVGFGNNGPIQPLLLDPSAPHTLHIAPAEARLVLGNISHTTDPDQKLWQYQHRIDPRSEWQTMYGFTELEFLPKDYEIMNFWTSQSRQSFFTYQIVVVKMVLEGDEVVGTLILSGGDVTKRVKGKTEHLRTCKTEEERVQALEDVFGLRLTDEERRGIRGMVTELKG